MYTKAFTSFLQALHKWSQIWNIFAAIDKSNFLTYWFFSKHFVGFYLESPYLYRGLK